MSDHDFRPAVDSLIAIHNGQPGRPPLHYPAPVQPRAVPRQALPGHGGSYIGDGPRCVPPIRPAAPAPRAVARQARHDHATVTRLARARTALARITRRTAA